MRINIKGNNIMPGNVAEALKTCEEEYGLKIKNLVLYVRYEDENGDYVEPTHQGNEIVRDFVFTKTKEIYKPVSEAKTFEPITLKEMIEILKLPNDRELFKSEKQYLTEIQEMGVDKDTFTKAYEITVIQTGKVSFPYLHAILKDKAYKDRKNTGGTQESELLVSISLNEMINTIEKQTGEALNKAEKNTLVFLYNLEIDKKTFETALYKVLEVKSKFVMHYFEKIALDLLEKREKMIKTGKE